MKSNVAFFPLAFFPVSFKVPANQARRPYSENELRAQPAVRVAVDLRDADIIGNIYEDDPS